LKVHPVLLVASLKVIARLDDRKFALEVLFECLRLVFKVLTTALLRFWVLA